MKKFSRWLLDKWYLPRPPVALVVLEWLFSFLVKIRLALYKSGILKRHAVATRIVVVGNISVGGNGKTPLIIWLSQRLSELGMSVGVICKGYKGSLQTPKLVCPTSSSNEVGDEAVLLARSVRVPVMAGRDRVAAARALYETFSPQIILSDDGLQHYRLVRDLEIVAVDSVQGFGNCHLLPAGPLREPRARLRTVDVIVLKGEGGTLSLPEETPTIVMKCWLDKAVSLDDRESRPLESFRGEKVVAVAAIASPDRFFSLLAKHGLDVEEHGLLDHSEVADYLHSLPKNKPILVTEKDAAKLAGKEFPDVWKVPLEVTFCEEDSKFLCGLVVGSALHLSGREPNQLP